MDLAKKIYKEAGKTLGLKSNEFKILEKILIAKDINPVELKQTH